MILLLVICYAIATTVYKPITENQDGPCSGTSGMLVVPNSLIAGTYKQFTIQGWFKRSSATSTTNNLLWLIGPDTNNYASFHLVAMLNDNLVLRACNAVNDCLVHTSSDIIASDTADVWTYVAVSMDMLAKRIHFKVIKHSDSQQIPKVFAETVEYIYTSVYQDTSGIVIKNKATNLHGLNGFCGKVSELTYIGGWYTTSIRPTYDLYSKLVIFWKTHEKTVGSALNAMSTTKDIGTMTGNTLPVSTSDWGWEFKQNQYVIFNAERSQFGNRFTISFNAYISNPNSRMSFFYRRSDINEPRLLITIISTGTYFDLLISVKNVVADTHGQLNAPLNSWVPITLSFYNNFNFFSSNVPPGMMLFDIITPTFKQVAIKSFALYSDSSADVYYIGDYPTTSTWQAGSGIFKYASIKIFNGFSYEQYTNTHYLGCLVQVSDMHPSCTACTKYTTPGNSDPFSMCQESAIPTYPTQLTTAINNCVAQEYTNTGVCTEIPIQYCLRGNASTCNACDTNPLTSTNPCVNTVVTQCDAGTLSCTLVKQKTDLTSSVVTKSLICKPKFYINAATCSPCQATCGTCITSTECITCPPNEFLQNNGFCAATCTAQLKNLALMKCVATCPIGMFLVVDKSECVTLCYAPYKTYKTQCLPTCPTSTYEENTICKDCNQKCYACTGPTNLECTRCNFGYYLAKQVCENFCSNTALIADQLLNTCATTCESPGVYYDYDRKQCLYVCPVGYAQNDSKICVRDCPNGQLKVVATLAATIPLINLAQTFSMPICTDCASGCSKCFAEEDPTSEYCEACIPGQFLVEQDCNASCSIAYPYEDSANQRCLAYCISPMYTYNFSCVFICPPATYMEDMNCIATCSVGKYGELTNRQCTPCATECVECTEGGPSHCTKCQLGYNLYNTTCVLVCPADKPYSDQDSNDCVASCAQYTLLDGYLKQCYSICPITYNVDGNNCVNSCSLGRYLKDGICLDCDSKCAWCVDETNRNCSKCTAGYYLDGKTCSDKCEENPKYYLSDYGYRCLPQCPLTLYMVDSLNKCMSQCPNTHVRLADHCLLVCPIGMYAEVTKVCSKCPAQCVECTAVDTCTVCQPKYLKQGPKCLHYCENNYYQDLVAKQCIPTCVLLINDDGIGNKQCVETCPTTKVLHVNMCLFDCPLGYYKQKELKTCQKCALECQNCTGPSNEECITCASGFELKDSFCVGICPSGTFLNAVSCEACAFRCITCNESKYNCQVCRGDRSGLPYCRCRDGYYDDRKKDLCQQCQPPCVNCASLTICATCKYNLQPPDCICKRLPPVQSNYCITCEMAFAESVRFSYDFKTIIVTFTYAITSVNEEAFFYTVDNCAKWFTNVNFGEFAVCLQNGKSYQVQLGVNPTIKPGEQILFKSGIFTDASSQLCQNTLIKEFRNTEVGQPNTVYPSVQLKYPIVKFSICLDVLIDVVGESGNAGRDLIYKSWTSSKNAVLNETLKTAKKGVRIPPKTLLPDVDTPIAVTVENFLGFQKTTTITLSTKSGDTPTLYLDFQESDKYYANQAIELPFKLYSYTCDDIVSETETSYDVSLDIRAVSTGSSVFNSTRTIVRSERETSSFILEKKTLLPNTQYKVIIKAGGAEDTKLLSVGRNQIDTIWLTKDRIVPNSTFQLSVNASDSDVNVNISMIGIAYKWSCQNMHLSVACRTKDKNLLTLPDSKTVNVSGLAPGYAYLFQCIISKDDRSATLQQQIIIANMNMTEQIFTTELGPKIEIRLTDDILYNVPVPMYYLVILKQQAILHIEFIEKPILRINLFTYLSGLANATDIQVILGGSQVRYNFNVLPALKVNSLSISPITGISLVTDFKLSIDSTTIQLTNTTTTNTTITNTTTNTTNTTTTTTNTTNTTIDDNVIQYQYYVYTDEQSLKYDLSNFSNLNGFLIKDWSTDKQFITKLPTCKFVLIKINQGIQYGFSYMAVNVQPPTQVMSIRNNIQYVAQHLDLNKTDTYFSYLVLLELYFLDRQECIYDCWSRGDCVQQVCVCDTVYYFFGDCSGVYGDMELWSSIGNKIFRDLRQADSNQIIFNAFEILFQLSPFMGVGDQTTQATDFVFNQLDGYLQSITAIVGVVPQQKQVANYQTAFNIMSFLGSLNSQLFSNNTLQADIKSINDRLAPTIDKLLSLTKATLLSSEKRVYKKEFMNITIVKPAANRRLLDVDNTQVEMYFKHDVYRLSNNFPYPNHSQPLYYSSQNQVRMFGSYNSTIPEQKLIIEVSNRHNYLCILSQDHITYDDVGCTQLSKVEPIDCTCTAGYVTVVDDLLYIYKPFYFLTDLVIDRNYVAIGLAALTVIFLILAIIVYRKDASDWETVKPQQEGFALKKDVNTIVTKLRKSTQSVRSSQIVPVDGGGSSKLFFQSKITEEGGASGYREPDSIFRETVPSQRIKQKLDDNQGYVSEQFTSNASNILKQNSIMGLIFRFRKNLGRLQRLWIVLGRIYLIIGIIGLVVNLQVIQLEFIIGYVCLIAVALRLLNIFGKHFNKKAYVGKQCQFQCISYFMTFLQLAGGGVTCAMAYLSVYDRLIVYWVIALGIAIAIDLIVTDLVLQLLQLLIDYLLYQRRVRSQADVWDMELEREQQQKLHGNKGESTFQEVVL